jgi:hypothetical protein
VLVVSLLASSLILLPIAVWLAIRWALIAPAAELEDLGAAGALRRSARLVRQEWLKVASLTVVAGALALGAGPVVGTLLILLTDVSLSLLNVVAGIVYAVTIPFVALMTAYVYFDTRVRAQLSPGGEPDELSAEIELS